MALLAVFFTFLCVARAAGPIGYDGTIHVAGLSTVQAEEARLIGPSYVPNYAKSGLSLINAWTFWANKTNALGGIPIGNNGRYYVNLTIINVGDINPAASAASSLRSYGLAKAALSSFTYHIALAPYSSLLTLPAAQACEETSTVLISGHASADNVYICDTTNVDACAAQNKTIGQRRWENTFALSVQGKNFMSDTVALFALYQAKTVGILYLDEPFSTAVASGVQDTAISYRMEVTFSSKFPPNFDTLPLNITSQWMQKVADVNPDVVIIGTNSFTLCSAVIKALKAINWLPKGISFTVCTADSSVTGAVGLASVQYMLGAESWNAGVRGPSFDESANAATMNLFPSTDNTSSSQIFVNEMTKQFGYFDSLWGTAVASGVAATKSIQLAAQTRSIDFLAVRTQMSRMVETCFYGPLSFNVWGVLARSSIGYQIRPDQLKSIVSPLTSSTVTLVYPMPTWEERIFNPGFFKDPLEVAMMSLATVGIAYCVVLLVLVVLNYHSPAIRTATSSFCALILVGGMLVLSSVWTWGLYHNESTCTGSIWQISVGFMMMFGCLFLKTWRLNRIFNQQQLTITGLSNTKMLAFALSVVAAEMVLLLIFTLATPFKTKTIVVDPLRPAFNYVECDVSPTFLIVTGTIKIVLLVFVVAITWRVRNIPSDFNEALYIGFASYNIFFCALIIVPIIGTGVVDRKINFVLRSIGIIFTVVSVESLLFLPKFYTIWTKRDNAVTTVTFAPPSGSGKTDSIKEQLTRLRAENEALRRQLNSLGGTVQEMTSTPKQAYAGTPTGPIRKPFAGPA